MGRMLEPTPPLETLHESPEEAARFRAAAEEIDTEKQRALSEPGPSWKDWWYFSASRWYMVLLFLIVDAWVLLTPRPSLLFLGLAVTIALAYAEFVFYQYLYHRPHPERRHRGARFRRTWYRPFEIGRWTPEGTAIRTGVHRRDEVIPSAEEGPTPEEFF